LSFHGTSSELLPIEHALLNEGNLEHYWTTGCRRRIYGEVCIARELNVLGHNRQILCCRVVALVINLIIREVKHARECLTCVSVDFLRLVRWCVAVLKEENALERSAGGSTKSLHTSAIHIDSTVRVRPIVGVVEGNTAAT
jgi:hypothetical protein